jgi:DNA-binding winged helix-turn-helix (wHTH) protein/Tol biopolymer transport system component
MRRQTKHLYEFGPFRLDVQERLLLQDGESVLVTPKAFDLLVVLVENSGHLLEKDELMQKLWPDSFVEEGNLAQNVSLLRKALGDSEAQRFIETVPRRGYRFIAPVIALPDEDETYLVEKRTTSEIIIDELEVERKPIAADEGQIETQRRALPAGSARQAYKAGFVSNLTRYQKAAMVGVLLIAAAGILIASYKWSGASKAKPAFSFDKMKMTRLNNTGNGPAVISPDGKYIAYMMYGTETDGLWVRQTATDSAVKLLPPVTCWGLTFTTDSNYVYCLLGGADHPDGALYKVPVLGGPAKLVLEGISMVRFSPDGSRMFFTRTSKETGNRTLITANLDGSDERVILPENSRYKIGSSDWSPDGKTIALSVTNNAEQFPWQVIEIPDDGGEERAISSPQKEPILNIGWLPDGSGLVMLAVDKATGLQQLWHLSYLDGQATRITNDSSWYTNLSVTSNGETILATRYAGGGASIWIGDAGDLNGLRKTTTYGNCLKWTPGGKLLYVDGEDGKWDVWIMNADAKGRERLTNYQSQSDWPEMSPDSRHIVFSSRRGGIRQVWIMDSDGRNPRQLTIGANECYWPKITSDSQWVVYSTWVAPSGWSVKKIPFEGGEPVAVAERAGEFVISPDGKMLAYQSFDEQRKRNVIVVKPMEGGEPIKVLDFPDYPIYRIEQWSKEGLLAISASSAQILLFPVDGHEPRQVSDFKTGERIFSYALSADGKQVAIARGIATEEAVMITNFK